MIELKSAGMVIFRRRDNKREYIILQYNTEDKYWGFAKGGIELEEDELKAALREVEEETALKDIKLVEGYKEEVEYHFTENNEKAHKKVIFFLGEALDNHDGEVSHEHQDFLWLEPKEAFEKITFVNDKNLLKKAEEFLERL
jgi:bis(5'-nucleosidyl)-tetraphosphatase